MAGLGHVGQHRTNWTNQANWANHLRMMQFTTAVSKFGWMLNVELFFYLTLSIDMTDQKHNDQHNESIQALSNAAGSHTCEECQGLLDGYFTGRMHKDGFYVRMECQKCGKEDNVRFYFANSPVLASEERGS